jgi:hypothetical protein
VTWTRKDGDIGFGIRFFDQYGIRRYERCGLASEGWSRRRAAIELENPARYPSVLCRAPRSSPDVVFRAHQAQRDHPVFDRQLQEAAHHADAAHPSRASEGKGPTHGRRSPAETERAHINHSIDLLSQVLDEAVRRPDLALNANPARDRKPRVKVPKTKPRDWLEPDEVMTYS